MKTTKYFGSIKTCRKNALFKKLQNFKTSHKNFKYKIHGLIMKNSNGTGNNCSVPSETYLQKDLSLLNITQSTEMDPFTCEKCDEAFDTIEEVRKHVNSYHGAKKTSIFRLEC